MNPRWFKFDHPSYDDERGFGTEEEAFEYAALMNEDRDGEPCKLTPLNEAQAAGLVVLVTPNTFVINDRLAAGRGAQPPHGE